MSIQRINRKATLVPSGRLGGVANGVSPDDAVNKSQLDAIQSGTVDLARIELSADGTAALPVITRDGDLNTGIYFPTTDEVGITAAGSNVVNVASTGIVVTGAIRATTTLTASSTTDSTTKDTGAIITEGGIGVEKAIFAGTTINAGTAMTVGTDITGAKEVDHVITVATTTTAATVGGKITVKGGTGATSGTGGASELVGGAAGVTAGASGGAVNITGGAEGAGLGITGAVNITTPNATGGAAGNIVITPGTSSSTTIAPMTLVSKGKAWKPLTGTVASGGTATGIQVAGGLLTLTGGTGNFNLPTAAQITTAVGATPAGTVIDFVVNAVGMTATNTATLVVGANMTVMAAPPITGGGTLTVTQDTQVVGYFRLIYDTATSCKIMRIA